MSYGENIADLYERAATYLDKILKGTKLYKSQLTLPPGPAVLPRINSSNGNV